MDDRGAAEHRPRLESEPHEYKVDELWKHAYDNTKMIEAASLIGDLSLLDDTHSASVCVIAEVHPSGTSRCDFSKTSSSIPRQLAVYTAGNKGPILVLLHGANYSAVSFTLLVQKLRHISRIVAYDAACHGKSSDLPVNDDGSVDATSSLLVNDMFTVVRDYISGLPVDHAVSSSAENAVVLIGHSMGAAIVAHAAQMWPADMPPLRGVVLMDLVEESAIAAIPRMEATIASMRNSFDTLDEAVDWVCTSRMLRLHASAAITVPYHLCWRGGKWTWRAWQFVAGTSKYWEGWFTGTNHDFLSSSAAKLLILSDVESLDKDLTIAQMQGKIQLQLIAGTGHVVHEDAPDKVAERIILFLSRVGLTADVEKELLRQKLERSRQGVRARP